MPANVFYWKGAVLGGAWENPLNWQDVACNPVASYPGAEGRLTDEAHILANANYTPLYLSGQKGVAWFVPAGPVAPTTLSFYQGGSEQYPVFDVNNDRFGWPNLTVTGISDIRGVVDGGNYNGNTYGNTGSTFKNCNVRGSFSVTSGHPISVHFYGSATLNTPVGSEGCIYDGATLLSGYNGLTIGGAGANANTFNGTLTLSGVTPDSTQFKAKNTVNSAALVFDNCPVTTATLAGWGLMPTFTGACTFSGAYTWGDNFPGHSGTGATWATQTVNAINCGGITVNSGTIAVANTTGSFTVATGGTVTTINATGLVTISGGSVTTLYDYYGATFTSGTLTTWYAYKGSPKYNATTLTSTMYVMNRMVTPKCGANGNMNLKNCVPLCIGGDVSQ